MYILYLDESGSVKNPTEEYFVLGGVAVPEVSIRWLSYELEKLAESIDPANPRQVEFHAAEIFNGGGLWGKYNKTDRIKVIKDVLLTLNKANPGIVTFACAIKKNAYPGVDLVEMAYEDVTSRFNMMLQRLSGEGNQLGITVFDKCSYEESLQSLARTFRQSGNKWGSQLRNICEIPVFIDSKATRIIQLADHVSYAVFRRYNANDLNYFNCVDSRFDQSDGVIHGLSHKHAETRTCTCPACITRRQVPSTRA
jgi:hypothetical protein